ncbi:MAG: serine/threonine-protein kinase [Longimicrobiales bacterium]
MRQRFLHEIKNTANLQHPHILPLHDSGEVDGTVYYVMPFVEGESLRARLNREKQLPVDDALRIAREVASALDYAHRHGVVHRDIKPENILLHDGQALVADFGIALAASNTESARLTETGISMGTPQYMSPESRPRASEKSPAAAMSSDWAALSTRCWLGSRHSRGQPRKRFWGRYDRRNLHRLPHSVGRCRSMLRRRC